MQAVILVGGEGTRLRPLTLTVPKPVLPLMNRPFLEFQIDLCRRYGVEDIILSTAYKPEVFEEHFGDGGRLGVRLTYVTEEEPLDTCGAVKNAEAHIDGRFLVFNGDVLSDLDLAGLIAYHDAKGAKATIYLTRVEDPRAYGLVPLDETGRIVEFLEKPTSEEQIVTDLINAGTYVLEPEVLDRVPAGERHSFERQLFPGLLDDGQPMYGFPSDAYWLDIGTPAKYLQAHHDILDRRLACTFPGKEIAPAVWAEEGAWIAADAAVGGPALIGAGCRIAAGAAVSRCVLGPGCCVGEGARLEGAVLHAGCRVGAGSVLGDCALAAGVEVGEGVEIGGQAVLGGGAVVGDANELRCGIRVWPGARIPASSLRF